jgi:glyoxylase-like metal-dependent hydrolase (beta-lactamase superfamily II)
MKRFGACVFLLCFGLLFSAVSLAATGDGGIFTSVPKTFKTASYWIEGPDGVVLIDTQFLPKESLELVEAAEKASGKKVTHAIVLHPNPDKFNGTAALQAKGVQVTTSEQVRKQIAAVHDIRYSWFAKEYAPDYPSQAAKPDVFGDKTVTLSFAGVPLTLHVLGRGASGAHVVVQHRDTVYVGDLINPENHAWLELGYIDDWLLRLEDIAAMRPQRIMPGRGKAGGVELLTKQADYLRYVKKLVRAQNPAGVLDWVTKVLLQRQIEQRYPDLGYPIFMRDGLAAVWRQEADNVLKRK